MYNTLNIAINSGTPQLKLQCQHIFGTWNIQKLYAEYLVHHTQNNTCCTIRKFGILVSVIDNLLIPEQSMVKFVHHTQCIST